MEGVTYPLSVTVIALMVLKFWSTGGEQISPLPLSPGSGKKKKPRLNRIKFLSISRQYIQISFEEFMCTNLHDKIWR